MKPTAPLREAFHSEERPNQTMQRMTQAFPFFRPVGLGSTQRRPRYAVFVDRRETFHMTTSTLKPEARAASSAVAELLLSR